MIEAFKAAQRASASQKNGCKGLDAMEILVGLWKEETKYANRDIISRCWRKADCLPLLDQIEIVEIAGHRDRNETAIAANDLNDLCAAIDSLRLKFAAIGETPAFTCGKLADPTVSIDNIERDKFRDGLLFWCHVEDDTLVQQVEIEEAVETIEKLNLKAESDTRESTLGSVGTVVSPTAPIPSSGEIESCLVTLRNYINATSSDTLQKSFGRFSRDIMVERLKRPKLQQSLQSYFSII